MSSSPRRAPLPPLSTTEKKEEAFEATPFLYREVAGPAGRAFAPGGVVKGRGESAPDLAAVAEAKELGRQQGERESSARFEQQLAQERSRVTQAIADFVRERAAYYQKVEREAVQLALAIARQVLHREAQVDPWLLMGIARVALEKIAGATAVKLAVHPQHAAAWRSYLASHLDAGKQPEVVEDPALAMEQCELRTAMGMTALGLEMQLKEIEQGLADLLAAKPGAKP